MTAMVDLAVAMVSLFAELLINLLSLALSSSFLARHSRGLKRWTYVVRALCSTHLFAGLVLPFLEDVQPYVLSPLFSAPVMLTSLVILLVALALPLAVDQAVVRGGAFAKGDTIDEKLRPPDMLIYALSVALVVGLFAVVSIQRERTTVREAVCDLADGRVGKALMDNGDDKVSIIERIARTNLINKVTCRKEEK